MSSLRAKLLNDLIEKLNMIPELEGKEEGDTEGEDPKGVSLDPEEVKIALQEEEGEEVPASMDDEEEMEEDPFAKLRGRLPQKKKKIMVEA